MIITLRPVSDTDKPFLAWLEEASMRDYAVALWGTWRPRPEEHFTLDGHRIMVADGIDAGCVAALPCSDHLEIDKLYVSPAYQNKGIGSTALKTVLAEASASGVCVRLTVLVNNPALAFYLRHGFRVLEETPERRLLST